MACIVRADAKIIHRFTYNDGGKIIGRDVYYKEGDQEKHVLKSTFAYFRNEELKQLLVPGEFTMEMHLKCPE